MRVVADNLPKRRKQPHARIARGLAAVFVWLMFAVGAQARTWESTDGKKVEGDYVSATASYVRIRRKRTGSIVKIPINRLSKEDRDFIRTQRETHREKSAADKAWDEDDHEAEEEGKESDDEESGAWQTIRDAVPLLDFVLSSGGGTITIWAVLLFVLHVVFIHVSTYLMRFKGHVSDAVKTGILEVILVAIVFAGSAGAISIVGELGVLLLFGVFLTGPIAILVIYDREFILSVVAYLLSLVMTALVNVGFFFMFNAIAR